MGHLLRTLLELGDATSQNLEFAYSNKSISFGEETISEMNLLEIRRRHPDLVQIETFSKAKESAVTGADWEWHIVGQRYTLKMRVQAKRVSKLGSIDSIDRRAQRSPETQIDLLLTDAKAYSMKPVYCFYCSEQQRTTWKKQSIEEGISFEAGCLLADANIVKCKMPKRLDDIETHTVPWHYLWSRRHYGLSSDRHIFDFSKNDEYKTIDTVRDISTSTDTARDAHKFPTVGELNGEPAESTDRTGLFRTSELHPIATIGPDSRVDRRISLLMVVDVREPDLMLRQFESMPSEYG